MKINDGKGHSHLIAPTLAAIWYTEIFYKNRLH